MIPHGNTLIEPLITVTDTTGRTRQDLTLPGVLHRLGRGEELEFAHLQPHQAHAWHAFLTQLGALAILRGGLDALQAPEASWRTALRALTEGADEPWCLVVDDLAKPALLQPPVPESDLGAFKHQSRFPDHIDVLVTNRNHDVKHGRMAAPRADHWFYALISMQTMSGFIGRGNYGIARMNSGYGARVCVALTPGASWAARFARDVGLWLEQRPRILSDGGQGYAQEGGHALLWTLPWDGSDSLPLQRCDPLMIEISRRMRLTSEDGVIAARWGASQKARVGAAHLNGNTGDLWVPVKKADEPAALTLSSHGFSYRLTHDLVGGVNYRPSPAQRPDAGDLSDQTFIAQGLVRGQGTTDGYRERWLPVPGRVAVFLATQGDRLGRMAAGRVAVVGDVARRALRPALCILLQGGPEDPNFKDARIAPWANRLDPRIDRIFFDALWADVDKEGRAREAAERRWKRRVIDEAAVILEQAVCEAPLPVARYYRAISKAEGMFWAGSRKHFPEAFPTRDADDDQPPSNRDTDEEDPTDD